MNQPDLSTRAHPLRPGARTAISTLAAAALVAAELVLPASLASAAPPDADYAQFVNPFIATEADFGQDGPGAFTPNGLAKVTPLTNPRSHTGYDYDSTQFAGFTGITLDGVGGSGAGGDFLVVPTYQSYSARPAAGTYFKDYSHAAESAAPGYYQVDDLTEDAGTIDARVTAATRTGVHEYTFDQAGTGSLVVDLSNNFGNRTGATLKTGTTPEGNTSLSGRLDGFFYNANYQLHYYAETTQPVSSVATWLEDELSTKSSRSGTDIGAILSFDVAAGESLGLRVTFSPISAAQAKRDMAAEVSGKSFEDVRAAATAEWNEALGAVEIDDDVDDDPTGDLKTQFYTHLFRMNGSPINATSTDGTYRGVDGVIYEADGYTHYDSWALWDDFRKYSSIAMIYPDRYRDIAQSLVDLFVELEHSSKSSLNQLTHSVPTVRWERAAVIIADAISKGAELEGLDLAYPALVSHSNGQYNATHEARGYIADKVAETVGTSYDDWGMSVIADALGKTAEAQSYRERSLNYVNLFDADALAGNAPAIAAGVDDLGLIMPKNGAGDSVVLDPERFEVGGAGLYQGTLWQYHWYTAQDMGGLVELMGGRAAAKRALSFHFGEQEPENCSRMLHSNANEIDLQAPYLFNYVGAPSHTQFWARQILTTESCNRYIATGSSSEVPSGNGEYNTPSKVFVYKNAPQGFLPTMDNDAGTMSSVFVAGALGLFPVTAGADSFQIGSPIFEKATIHYPNGRSFAIEANGVNAENFYVQDATLDGAAFDRTWLTFDELTSGGALSLTMGEAASTWGEDSPMAFSLSDEVDSHVYDPSAPVASSRKVFTESSANDGTIDSTITLTGHGTTFSGDDGSDLTAHVQSAGVPAGLEVRATKVSDTTIELELDGAATAHSVGDSTDALVITLAPEAFASEVPTEDDRSLGFKVTFAGYEARVSTTQIAADGGSVDASFSVELFGGATFAGDDGEPLVPGAFELVGLASGLSPSSVKDSATSLTISLAGTLAEIASSTFVLRFADAAFEAPVTAGQVTGAGLSSMSPVTITVRGDLRGELSELIEEAQLVELGSYAPASFAALQDAIALGDGVLEDTAASDAALRHATAVLHGSLDALTIIEGGYRRLEAEANDVWSGGELKTEGGGTGVNVGGVERGAWLGFLGIDLTEAPLSSFVIAYAHNPGSASASSSVEIRTGAPDGPVVTEIPLPTTGGWGNYVRLEHELSPTEIAALDGVNDVYLVFQAGPDTNRRWVANPDYIEFVPEPDESEPGFEFAELGPNDVTTMGPGMGRDPGSPPYSNFGNTHDGEWIHFADVDFGPDGADSLKYSYDKPTDRSIDNTWIEIRLDDVENPSAAVSDMLDYTGTGWNNYALGETAVDREVFTGTHDVYVLFRMDQTHTSGAPYVANFRWFRFGDSTAEVDSTRHTVEFESIRDGNGSLASAPELVAGEDYSGGGLKTEDGNGGAVLAGTENGTWVRYQGVDLGDEFGSQLHVTYAAPSHRSNEPSIAVYAGTRDGEPLVVADLPITGGSWSDYATAVIDLPTELTGENTLYVEFRSVPVPGKTNVGNFDAFSLVYGADKSALRDAIASWEDLLDDAGLYVAADFAVFETALADALALATDFEATAQQVKSATRKLNLAGGHLEWKVVRQLRAWITKAEAVAPGSLHPVVLAKLEAMITEAKSLDPSSDPHEAFVSALDALTTEYERMDDYVSTTTSFLGAPAKAFDDEKLEIVVGVSDGASGDVELAVDGAKLAAETLGADGSVTFDIGALAKGEHSLVASYLGDDLFLPSASAPVTISVSGRPAKPEQPVDPKPAVAVSTPVLSKATQASRSVKKARATVSATVNGTTSGRVTFTSGMRTLGSATVRKVGGKYTATLRIKGKLPRGKYRAITASVRATDGRTATSSPSAAVFRVVKATPKKARPKVIAKKFRAGTRPTFRIKVAKLTNGRYATGRIRVKVGTKTATIVKLRAKGKGKITVRLPRAYSSSIKVSVRYLPKKSQVVKKSKWSKKVTVRASH